MGNLADFGDLRMGMVAFGWAFLLIQGCFDTIDGTGRTLQNPDVKHLDFGGYTIEFERQHCTPETMIANESECQKAVSFLTPGEMKWLKFDEFKQTLENVEGVGCFTHTLSNPCHRKASCPV